MTEPTIKPTKQTKMPEHDKNFNWRDGVDIKEYFEKKIDDLCRYYDSKLDSIAEGIQRASEQMDKRMNEMNENRATLRDAQLTFVPMSEFKAVLSRISDDIRMLRESRAMLEGKASQNSVILAIILSVIGIIIGATKYFVRM